VSDDDHVFGPFVRHPNGSVMRAAPVSEPFGATWARYIRLRRDHWHWWPRALLGSWRDAREVRRLTGENRR
jgi:hypothetical protein